ncbi:MAG: hypothetical protein ACM31O_03850 [Bacteroidota bacterium]
MNNVVVVHFDEQGESTFLVCGENVRLLIVDERAPHDRIYEWLSRDNPAELEAILGNDPIGSSADSRHQAIAARIEAECAGKPHLKSVE